MNTQKILSVSILAAVLSACGGGDINIAPSTTDNSVDNSVTETGSSGTTSPCASYTDSDGVTFQGFFENNNCTYATSFVDLDKPLAVDLTIPAIPGVHVFQGSLVVGQNYTSNADLTAAGITEGGDGPTLTIEAGQTLAFQSNDDYFVINRGSQLMAEGTATNPITITATRDAIDGLAGPEEVSLWGGMIINGFGVTNDCEYTGSRGVDIALASECHVAAEGRSGAGQTNYGGDNDGDSSGSLEYFVVKHTGAEVAAGNELNGISFNAVGSGTNVDFLETYSTFDDGIEFFGGAVNVSHFLALYVRDDSIDIDEGYRGTIDYALVIQSETDGNRCLESDGVAGHSGLDSAVVADFIARGLNSAATIRNLTCIISAQEVGTHDPGQGFRIREAHIPTIENALVTTAFSGDERLGDDDFNYCARIDDEGQQAALDGDLVIAESIFACQDLIDSDLEGQSTLVFLDATNQTFQTPEAGDDPTAASNPNLVLFDSFYSVPLADMIVNGGPVTVTPTQGGYVGGISRDDDWIDGWTFGLQPNNRSQDLWFE